MINERIVESGHTVLLNVLTWGSRALLGNDVSFRARSGACDPDPPGVREAGCSL